MGPDRWVCFVSWYDYTDILDPNSNGSLVDRGGNSILAFWSIVIPRL